MPVVAAQAASAPIKPRRPSGACSTRNTIELKYSPPTESPCTIAPALTSVRADRDPNIPDRAFARVRNARPGRIVGAVT